MIDLVLITIITGVTGFVMGIILHPKLKDYIYYGYLSSPIEISSENVDQFEGKMNVKNFFDDIITLTNNSDRVIRIKEMEVSVKLQEEAPEGYYFKALFYENREALWESMKRKSLGVAMKEYSTKNFTPISSMGYRIGLLPVEIRPHDSIKLHFGLIGSDGARAKFLVIPKIDYKKNKLEYEIGF